MPRGYLRHQSGLVGREVARGGGGGTGKQQKSFKYSERQDPAKQIPRHQRKHFQASIQDEDWDYLYDDVPFGDDLDDLFSPTASHVPRETVRDGACPICLESRQLLKLMKSCKHVAACCDCQRDFYLGQCLGNVTRYPIRCFYPGCCTALREVQLRKLSCSEAQLVTYLKNSVLAKVFRSPERTVVHCPRCYHPHQLVHPQRESEYIHSCSHCRKTFYFLTLTRSLDAIVLDAATVRAADVLGQNAASLIYGDEAAADGWGLCPSCNCLMRGGNMRDDVVECACRNKFAWIDATSRVEKIRKYSRRYDVM